MEQTLQRAGIPNRYKGKTLQNYQTEGKHPSLYEALIHARKFVDTYPYKIEGVGLMFVGSAGLGKTHLAAGMLRFLILEKRVNGLFIDFHELLKQIQNSYNASVSTTELSLLRPIFDAEILVLDDLGATRPTDWVWDTVSHILNARYGKSQPTIITTNFPNQRALPQREGGGSRPSRADTLGDRIGDRMRSRLQEMCHVIEMQGEDRRERENKADLHFL